MWYYTTGGAPEGPFDEAALDQLLANGTIHADSLVWKEGMADWAPLNQARTPAAAGAATATCTMCGQPAGNDDLVELLGHRVCAACKPRLVQSLREGASVPTAGESAWRDGKRVVTMNRTVLPARCFKCNRPAASPPLKRKVYWHHPAFFLLIIPGLFLHIGLLFFVVVSLFIRKRAEIEVHLCESHANRRRTQMIVGWSMAAAGFAAIAGAIVFHIGWPLLLGLPAIVLGILIVVIGSGTVGAARINKETVWLRGAGKDFLESLRPWTGGR
ncbi:MAG: DUF4339 domain-containing protein [Verrucomicrobiota bacterium]